MSEERRVYEALRTAEAYFRIAVLCKVPKTVAQIADAIKQTVYETGKDLKWLEEKGVVQYTADGKWVTTPSAVDVMKKYWGISS